MGSENITVVENYREKFLWLNLVMKIYDTTSTDFVKYIFKIITIN